MLPKVSHKAVVHDRIRMAIGNLAKRSFKFLLAT